MRKPAKKAKKKPVTLRHEHGVSYGDPRNLGLGGPTGFWKAEFKPATPGPIVVEVDRDTPSIPVFSRKGAGVRIDEMPPVQVELSKQAVELFSDFTEALVERVVDFMERRIDKREELAQDREFDAHSGPRTWEQIQSEKQLREILGKLEERLAALEKRKEEIEKSFLRFYESATRRLQDLEKPPWWAFWRRWA